MQLAAIVQPGDKCHREADQELRHHGTSQFTGPAPTRPPKCLLPEATKFPCVKPGLLDFQVLVPVSTLIGIQTFTSRNYLIAFP